MEALCRWATLTNTLVALESVVSLLGLAVVTGLVFARFSRPVADILFSQNAVMSWMGNLRSFQFRIINTRNNQIIDLHVRVLVSRFEPNASGIMVRRYYPLKLERESVVFFPLSWTIVHTIDKDSPLFGVTEDELCATRRGVSDFAHRDRRDLFPDCQCAVLLSRQRDYLGREVYRYFRV